MSLFSKNKKDKKQINKSTEANSDMIHDRPESPVLPGGNDPGAYKWVVTPHITEKATGFSSLNKYVFKVSPTANKIEVKKAIEGLYKVKVQKVNMQTIPSKRKQVGKHKGFKDGFRKAIITVREGDKIDIV